MSWLEQDKSKNFHIRFRFGGTKFRRSLQTRSKSKAESRLHRLDENMRLVESGRLQIPSGSDVAAFLLSDGRLNGSIRKELGTLGMIWQWAKDSKHIKGSCPKKGIRFPKEQEKPLFQTWQEIEKHIEISNLRENQEAELWDCLFVTLAEVEQVLEYVKELARYPFMYPRTSDSDLTENRENHEFARHQAAQSTLTWESSRR